VHVERDAVALALVHAGAPDVGREVGLLEAELLGEVVERPQDAVRGLMLIWSACMMPTSGPLPA